MKMKPGKKSWQLAPIRQLTGVGKRRHLNSTVAAWLAATLVVSVEDVFFVPATLLRGESLSHPLNPPVTTNIVLELLGYNMSH